MRQITKNFFQLGQRQNNLNLSSKNKLSYSFNILFKIFQLNNTKIVVATLKVVNNLVANRLYDLEQQH